MSYIQHITVKMDFANAQKVSGLIIKRRLIPAKKMLYELRSRASNPEDVARYNTALLYLLQDRLPEACSVLEDRARLGPQLLLHRAHGASSPTQAGPLANLPSLPIHLIQQQLQTMLLQEQPPKPACARTLTF